MKESKFNFYYKRGENENIIYNTFSKALVSLDDDEFSRYKDVDTCDNEMMETLKENGILIEESFNEMDFLKYFHYKTKFSNETLYLTRWIAILHVHIVMKIDEKGKWTRMCRMQQSNL